MACSTTSYNMLMVVSNHPWSTGINLTDEQDDLPPPSRCCYHLPLFIVLWLGASKAGSGLGLSGPLKGPGFPILVEEQMLLEA
ncbi:unnamed protein product [Caretta caretta]